MEIHSESITACCHHHLFPSNRSPFPSFSNDLLTLFSLFHLFTNFFCAILLILLRDILTFLGAGREHISTGPKSCLKSDSLSHFHYFLSFSLTSSLFSPSLLFSPPLLSYVIYSLVGSVSQTRQLMMQSRKSLLPRSSFLNPNGMEFEISFLEKIFFPASASYSAFYSVSISSFDSFSLSTGWKTNTITMMIMTMITIAKRMDSQSTPFFIFLSLILYQEKRMKSSLTFSL